MIFAVGEAVDDEAVQIGMFPPISGFEVPAFHPIAIFDEVFLGMFPVGYEVDFSGQIHIKSHDFSPFVGFSLTGIALLEKQRGESGGLPQAAARGGAGMEGVGWSEWDPKKRSRQSGRKRQ